MTDFQALIKEAFIEPIRSVFIVDDQYPTWEEILNERRSEESRDHQMAERSSNKNWRVEPNGTLNIINQFRQRKPGLIIDIHDAPNAEQTADHLHQSDLLILDYNLEGEASGLEGRLARGILKSVLRNQHFNLVIVHTQERDLNKVFYNCLVSLSTPLYLSFEKQKILINDVLKRLEELSDEEKFNRDDLVEYFDLDAYIKLRHPALGCGEALKQYMKGHGPLSRLHEWAEKLDLKNGKKMGFAYWAIEEFEKERKDIFSDEPFDGLSWAQQDNHLWLRTGRGFVTFVEKGHEDLINELQLALEAWQPSPSRLLSAKVRHEISCNGVEAEDRTLFKSYVFAYFYDLIRNSETEGTRAALVREHLNCQTEILNHQIAPSILKFGESIFNADANTGHKFASHYDIDMSDKSVQRRAATHFNSYISTLPLVAGDDYLDCGHVFKVNSEWWVCATPACDMQPGQNTIAFIGNSNELRPFTALKLSEISEAELTDKHINSGLYCFAETEPGRITILGLPSQNTGNSAAIASEKITWRTFVAKRDGRLIDKKFNIICPKLLAGEIDVSTQEAEIKAKLRYEYALNYIQKVGTSVTRIGLGYRANTFV